MAFSLDHHYLRTSHPKHGGPYLHRVAVKQRANADNISQELLHGVTTESLPPRVYELWLCACPDETAIVLGLQQQESVACRRSAIKALHRWFRTAKCVEIWRAVGGTRGIVTMLANFSVDHVKAFCKRIGRCSTSLALRKERQDLVTDLMYALASDSFPNAAPLQNPDRRPLLEEYALLIYGCTPEARDTWIEQENLPKLDMVKVMRTDTEHYQQRCRNKAAAGDMALWRYSPLFISPSLGTSNNGHNIPMGLELATEVLETLVSNDTKPAESTQKVGEALIDIIMLLARRKVPSSFALNMVRLISSCGRLHVVQELQKWTGDYQDYLLAIAQLWSHDPERFEPPLSGMVQTSTPMYRHDLVEVLSTIVLEKRYRLCRWLHFVHYNIDIDVADQLLSLTFPIRWGLITMLPKPEARTLTERIVSVKSEQNDWLRGSHAPMPDLKRNNVKLQLMRCILLDSDEARLSGASRSTAMYQEMAAKERDAECRIGWVTASVVLAVASGSLDLLKDVLLWVRRFNKDPLISRFYGHSWLRSTDTFSLLAGISEKPAKNINHSNVAASVRKGNEIALLLLETASICQKEPSFYVNHWRLVQHLFVDIVQTRLQRVKRLQSLSGLSDNDMYETVWEPTLNALVDAEALGLADRNQALGFNTLGGPLAVWGRDEITVRSPNPSICRFFDQLATRRDALWRTYRPSVHPGAVTLQAPWPRGLPMQALLAVQIEGRLSDDLFPFICERARNIVFVPREVALAPVPEDKDTQAAIGCFVDNYCAALRVYLSWCDGDEKQRRIEAAWNHALAELSEDRLSDLEATAYWEDAFTEAGVTLPASFLKYPQRAVPKLPGPDIADEMTEWNPDEGPRSPIFEERTLEPTFLDCNLKNTYSKDINSNFTLPRPTLTSPTLTDFWDLDRFGSVIPPDAKEAFIAAGLLLLGTLPGARSIDFSTLYPTSNDARFPAVFLDLDFVVAQSDFETLPSRLLSDTPPAMLEQLMAALFTKLEAEEDPDRALVRYAFETLKSLAWSDRPGIAIKHIIHVVIELPEHSSWHRVMLHHGILKRLTAHQSKALIVGLADAVAEKSKQRSQSKTGDDASSPKSFVKVSTVKLLAQLMSHAEFVDEAFSVEMLGKLFKENTHIDIRTAIVESLIEVASTSKKPGIEEAVIALLEVNVVPVAAQLLERALVSATGWKDCEEKGELPEIDDVTPIGDAIWAYTTSQFCRHSASKIAELVRRLLLPLVKQSKANHQRWVQAFLRANGASEDLAMRIPGALGSQDLLRKLLKDHTAHTPAGCFHDLHELTLFFAEPPKELQDLEERLTSTKPKPPGYETWQKNTESAARLSISLGTYYILKTAVFATSQEQETAPYDLVSPSQLQTHERAVVDVFLKNFDSRVNDWRLFADGYSPPTRQRESVQLAWQLFCLPLVQYMLESIEVLRSTAWQQDPRRQPCRLPDSFELKLWLLSYPSMPWRGDSEYEARREKFAAELREIVGELAKNCIERGRPYHAHLKRVVEAAKACYEKDWAILAWRLGAIADGQDVREFGLADLLRVEVADALLQEAMVPVSEEVLRGVKVMLERWKWCFDEEVRERGIVTTEILRENLKKRKTNALSFVQAGELED